MNGTSADRNRRSNEVSIGKALPGRLRTTALLAILFAAIPGCMLVNASLEPFSRKIKPLQEYVVDGEGHSKILLLDISRTITDESEEVALGFRREASVVARLEEELKHAAKDDAVKAVVLRINSPGGTVTASDIAYRQIVQFKADHGVPVVAQLMDIAASGGYYVALAADRIVAYPTTVTGSIGVIFHGVSLEGLLDKIGIEDQTVKSGSKKDIGSPLRKMTPEERALLQDILGEMKARFISLVRKNRPALTDEAEKLISDGRILSARQAMDLGLVDRIGSLEDSIALAKELADLSKAKVVLYRRPEEHAEGIYADTSVPNPTMGFPLRSPFSFLNSPQFLYLWAPGIP